MIIDKQTWLNKNEGGLLSPDFPGLEKVKGFLSGLGPATLGEDLHFLPSSKGFESLEKVTEFLNSESTLADLYVYSLQQTKIYDTLKLAQETKAELNNLKIQLRKSRDEEEKTQLLSKIDNIQNTLPSKDAYQLFFLTHYQP